MFGGSIYLEVIFIKEFVFLMKSIDLKEFIFEFFDFLVDYFNFQFFYQMIVLI